MKAGIGETDVCFLQVLPLQSNGRSVSRADRQSTGNERTRSASSGKTLMSVTSTGKTQRPNSLGDVNHLEGVEAWGFRSEEAQMTRSDRS